MPLRKRLGLAALALSVGLVGLGSHAGCRSAHGGAGSEAVAAAWDGFGTAACVIPAAESSRGVRLIVGAPTASRSGEVPVGALYEVAWVGGGVRPVRWGGQPHERYAESLCLLRDLNGDGVPELAVGSPGASGEAGDGCGKIEILSGRDYSPVREVWGTRKGQRFGTKVVSTGEWGTPGAGVIIVLHEDPGTAALGAEAFSADLATRMWTIAPMAGGEGLSSALTACPDLDDDGVPEVGVSFPFAKKDRRPVGRYSVHSGKSGRALFEYWGSDDYEMIGTSASVLGPAEPPDRFNLLLGAPHFKKDGSPLGRVQVIAVPSGRRVHERAGATVGAKFGFAVVSPGEVTKSRRLATGTFAVAAVIAPEARSPEGKFIAGSGYVECVRVGGETPAFAIEGLQQWGMLGKFMLWSEAEDFLVLGAPGSFDTPSLRDLRSKSFLCVVPGAASARVACRVFTSLGEVPRADLGKFVRVY